MDKLEVEGGNGSCPTASTMDEHQNTNSNLLNEIIEPQVKYECVKMTVRYTKYQALAGSGEDRITRGVHRQPTLMIE